MLAVLGLLVTTVGACGCWFVAMVAILSGPPGVLAPLNVKGGMFAWGNGFQPWSLAVLSAGGVAVGLKLLFLGGRAAGPSGQY